MPGLLVECDPQAPHLAVVAAEIIRVQEEEHPSAALATDTGELLVVLGLCEDEPRARGARGLKDDPPPALAERGVLDKYEAELRRVETDGLVVVADKE